MSELTAVRVDHVAKSFRISTDPVYSLKERLVRLGRSQHVTFDALHDIDLDITEGQTVGILGHNGSGKSTLLKCIAGIIAPTSGQVLVRGRLTSLLELGAGFHPELSGRENVYINAAFYGMGRAAIDERFDAIVEFAELAKFIDEPVKHYSSGMYVRLGFAVAVNLDPDVLLVDEVLAVGDELFQAKCLSRIKQFQKEGRTIIFVTHDAATVRQICDRAVVIDHGNLVVDGAPNEAITTFRERLHGNLAESPLGVAAAGAIGDVVLRASDGSTGHVFAPGGEFVLDVALHPDEPITEPIVGIEITDRQGNQLYSADTDDLRTPLGELRGEQRLQIRIGRLWLLDGEFAISLKLTDRSTGAVIDWREGAAEFEVRSDARASGSIALDVSISAD